MTKEHPKHKTGDNTHTTHPEKHSETGETEVVLNKAFWITLVVVLVVGIVVWSVFKFAAYAAQTTTEKKQIIEAETPKKEIALAIVNKQVITESEVKNRYNQLPLEMQQRISQEQYLEVYINELLLMQKAESIGINISVKETVLYIQNTLAKTNTTQDDFWKGITASGTTRPEIIELARQKLMLKTLFDKIVYPNISITIDESEEFYKNNSKMFEVPEQIRARHILVKTEEEANDVLKRLAKDDFGKVALEVSIDKASGAKGGELGFFKKGDMIPEFEKIAFSMKVGGVSEPIKSQYGYHIINLEEKKSSSRISYTEAKEKIQRYLLSKKAEERIKQLTEELRSEAKIEYK